MESLHRLRTDPHIATALRTHKRPNSRDALAKRRRRIAHEFAREDKKKHIAEDRALAFPRAAARGADLTHLDALDALKFLQNPGDAPRILAVV